MEELFEYRDCIKLQQSVNSINVYGVDKVSGKNPLYTIAIPTYKRTETLIDTIESALAQVRSEDYHVIVVDNNPERNDKTELLMAKYKENPKVSYYKNRENVGMAGNWNKCFILSPSNNVVLLHDDDIISPFALSTFSVALKKINVEWCYIKPELLKFSKTESLIFHGGGDYYLRKLTPVNFSYDCPVGAPSCILYNKNKFLESGGFNSEFYPCIDYVHSFRMMKYGKAYLLTNGSCLGGYRVANNESLSEFTMDKYFQTRYKISNSILSSLRIPKLLRDMIQSSKNEGLVNMVLTYYNMEDYRFKEEYFPFKKLNPVLSKFTVLMFNTVLRINNYLNRRKIIINL